MTRIDVHRPADLDPDAYTLNGVWDLDPEEGDHARQEAVRQLVARGYSFAEHQQPGCCGHCGHIGIRYAALLAHNETRELIYVGKTCLSDRFELSQAQFRRVIAEATEKRARHERKAAREALLAEQPVLVWLTYADNFDYDTRFLHGQFFRSLNHQLANKGELSKRQIDAFAQALHKETERHDRQAARERRAAELAAQGVTAPEGRVTIEGEIVSIKFHDHDYGGSWKMVVRNAEGWAVWSTIPGTLISEAQDIDWHDWTTHLTGRRARFTATVTRADDDPLFGFAKRPSKASLLDPAPTSR